MLVGPKSNPAGLDAEEDILRMFNKIVTMGNADVAVCHSIHFIAGEDDICFRTRQMRRGLRHGSSPGSIKARPTSRNPSFL